MPTTRQTTKKLASIVNVNQIFKAEELSPTTVETYYDRIFRLTQAVYPAVKIDKFHYISIKRAGMMLAKYDKVEKTLNQMYPLNGEAEEARKNKENQKTFYSAIRTLVRGDKLSKWVGEDLQKKYQDKVLEL